MEIIRSSLAWLFPRYAHTTANSSSVMSEENPDRYCRGGYHPVHLGECFNGKYKIISKLGYGVYSTVWLAKDEISISPHYVALKILTADSYGGPIPIYELDILKHIREIDQNHPGYQHVVQLKDDFVHEGPNGKHLCLVLDLMGPTIWDLLQQCPKKQLPSPVGRQLAAQILQAFDWLHESCGIIHTDIKPDCILIEIPDVNTVVQNYLDNKREHDLAEPLSALISRPILNSVDIDYSQIRFRLTDFGVASWKDKHLIEWIQPPGLRAPEVFLGAPWDGSVDIWNFACVLYELVQGRFLFRGRPGPKGAWSAEEDQLAGMIELFGPFPASLRKRGKLTTKYFDNEGELLNIKQLYPCSLRDLLAQTKNPSMSAKDYEEFEGLLKAMLRIEPGERKSPKELVRETWVSN